MGRICGRKPTNISIRAPAKGATVNTTASASPCSFQFAPPRRGRQAGHPHAGPGDDFNSRPREGGDSPCVTLKLVRVISIRAPAKGATSSFHFPFTTILFQFAPPRRGRPRKNRDPLPVGISIRAPAKGATGHGKRSGDPPYFNSRPREGGDRTQSPLRSDYIISIRAPAKGATHTNAVCVLYTDFNSRPREGGDLFADTIKAKVIISIRAPAKGATIKRLACMA